MALTDHCRVMVVGPSGMAADAITKAVAVLGPEQGLKLIEQSPGMAAMVKRSPSGKVEHYESSRWKELRQVQLGGEPIELHPLHRKTRAQRNKLQTLFLC